MWTRWQETHAVAQSFRGRTAGILLAFLEGACTARPKPEATHGHKWSRSTVERIRRADTALLLKSKRRDLGTDTSEVYPGRPDSTDMFPEVVAVGNDNGWQCSGVLVSPVLAMTAAHCPPPSRIYVGPQVIDTDAANIYTVNVDSQRWGDIALLRIQAIEGRHLRFLPLATGCPERFGTPLIATLVGFGSAFPESIPDGLRGYGRTRLAEMTCAGSTNRLPCNPAEEFALTASPGDSDTCEGDSGGPVLAAIRGNATIVGITSRSIDGSVCGRGGIYVRGDLLQRDAARLGIGVVPCQ